MMLTGLILAGVLACCGNEFGSPWPQLPPARYDHAYHGRLTVHFVDPQQLYAICHTAAWACAMPHGASCTIYLPVPTSVGSPEVYAALRRHEIGHCNGWPANHPQ